MNRLSGILLTTASLTALATGSGIAAAADRLSLTTGVDYSTGKYGGTQSTDITYVPITAKYQTGPWTLKLTLPYITVTGPGNVVPDVGQVSTSTTTRTTESGMGDVVAGATYNVYWNKDTRTAVDLTGKVKFGTADEKKGLGTGKNDYSFQVDVYKSFDRLTPFGTVGYKVLGDPAGYTLDNVFYGSLGFAYKVSSATSAGAIMDLRERSTPTGSPRRELTGFVTHKLDRNWKLQGYAVKGFSDGSPAWGAGAMVTYSF
jgi:hypothetical protein